MKPQKLLTIALMAAALQLPAADKNAVSRLSVVAMERSFDGRVASLWSDDPFVVLGLTRGVYIHNFGAVFTAEVNLATAPGISPFRPVIGKEEAVRQRQKKLNRLPQLREAMREMLVSAAASLDNVPADEQIVVGVTISQYAWEDTTGLPSQILMQGQKKLLLAAQSGRATLESAIRVEEF